MNKKKIAALLLGGILTVGVAFNVATTASYRQDLGTATQALSAGTWSVEMGNGLKAHTIFPGDVVGQDTMTLKNNNNYAVKFTVKLTVTDKGLNDALTLDLLNGTESTGIARPDGTIEFLAAPNSTNVLASNVTWTPKDDKTNLSFAGKSVSYNYNVVAEAMPEIKQIVSVSNSAELQTKLGDATLQSGTAIMLAAGQYNNNINLNKTIHIIGEGNGKTQFTGKITLQKGVENVRIEGLTFSGDSQINCQYGGNNNLVIANNTATNVTNTFMNMMGEVSRNVKVLNNTVSGVTNSTNNASGFIIWNVENCDFLGNTVEGVQFHGVQFNSNSGVVNVMDNKFKNIKLCAIQFADYINGEVNVSNNTIDNAAQSPVLSDGTWNYSAIRLYSSKNGFNAAVSITNNKVTNSKFGLLLSHRDGANNIYDINAKVNSNNFMPVEGDYVPALTRAKNAMDFIGNEWNGNSSIVVIEGSTAPNVN